MKSVTLLALLSLAFALTAPAKTFKLPEEEPFASITLPDAWESSEIESGIQANSPDNEIFLSVETTNADEMEAIMDEAIDFLEKAGVTVDEKSVKQEEGKMAGLDVVNVSWTGRDKHGPAEVVLTIVLMGEDQALLVTYWGTPEGAKKHSAAIDAIGDSIKKLE